MQLSEYESMVFDSSVAAGEDLAEILAKYYRHANIFFVFKLNPVTNSAILEYTTFSRSGAGKHSSEIKLGDYEFAVCTSSTIDDLLKGNVRIPNTNGYINPMNYNFIVSQYLENDVANFQMK